MTVVRPLLTAAAVAAMQVVVAGGLGSPAVAGGGVHKEGHCEGSSEWRLEAQPDDGRIRVRGEVRSNWSGRYWRWRILHDGGVAARGHATTGGGGDFKVERLLVNSPGKDHIGWRAVSRASGETCRGRLTY